jgi:hypothetical protein
MRRELHRREPRRDYNFVPSGRASNTAHVNLVTESSMQPAFGRSARLFSDGLFRAFLPALFIARDWKRGNVSFDAAEAAIAAPLLARVQSDWTSLDWMPAEWAGMAESSFTDGELDTLVNHFHSDVGRKQAKIIEHSVQFHVAGALTMSGKLIQGFPGTEEEQKILTYVWDDEDREARFSFKAVENVEGQRFALSPLGAKYQRTLIIKVSGILGARLDRVAAALAEQARGMSASADPFVAEFLATAGR